MTNSEATPYIISNHSAIKILKDTGGLVAGGIYQITDYATTHRINGTSIIHKGPMETLTLKALTPNTFDSIVISTLYPKDTIRYDITDVLCEDGITPRPGFITYRKDNILNNEVIGYDFRNVVFKKGRAQAGLWSAATTYLVGAIVKHSIGGVMRYYILTRDNVAAGTAPVASPVASDVWDFLFNETDNFYAAEEFQYYRDGNYIVVEPLTISTTDLKYFYTFNAFGHDASNGNYDEFKGSGNIINNTVTNDGVTFFATNDGAGIFNNKSLNPGNQSTFHSNKVNDNTFDYLALGLFLPGCEIYGNFLNFYNALFKGIFCRSTMVGSYLNYYGGNYTDSWTGVYTNQNIIKANFQFNRLSMGSCVIGHTFSNNSIAGTSNSVFENSCQNIKSLYNVNTLGTLTVPIKLNSVQFNQSVEGLNTSAGVTLNKVIFNTALTNKTISTSLTDVSINYASPNGKLWYSTMNDAGVITNTSIA